jgi:RNase H-fold protein (predicted Holliday junction resolvase)
VYLRCKACDDKKEYNTARFFQKKRHMRRVLSFDVGLRNLGAAVVRSRPDWVFARTYVTPDETADAFKTRAFVDFLSHGWELERWRVFDVTEVLERPDGVKNVKRLNLVTKTTALTNTLTQLETEWFPDDDAPHTVVTEVQHNGNAEMRAVGMAILMFFSRSMPDTALTAVSGSHKLKVCAALGVAEGDGLASRPSVLRRAAKAAKTGKAVVVTKPTKVKKYEDNKRRAILAVDVLLSRFSGVVDTGVDISVMELREKKDDLADALLQGLWVLWNLVAPKAPLKSRKRTAVDATEANKRRSVIAPPELLATPAKSYRDCDVDLTASSPV